MRPIFWNTLGIGLAILAVVALCVWFYQKTLAPPKTQEA